jgi:hypothetical protein
MLSRASILLFLLLQTACFVAWTVAATRIDPDLAFFVPSDSAGEDEDTCASPWAESEASWSHLSEERQAYYAKLGWNEFKWDASPKDREVSVAPFNPQKIRLPVPALEKIDFDYLAELLASHEVMLVGGTLLGDDENTPRTYMTMKEYLRDVRDSKTSHYLKYDDDDQWKASIEQGLGGNVLQNLLHALQAADQLPFHPCAEYPIGQGWTFWVGAANTSTGMHYDDADYAFLYVVAGRKRVVMLPNDERTYNLTCETFLEGHSCWTGINILSGPLPPHAVEFELGPGEGIVIPQFAWHAVQNLEPTIAFGVLLDEDSFCGGKDNMLSCPLLESDAEWAELSEERKAYYLKRGWNESMWDGADREVSVTAFNPHKIRLSVPALERIDFDYLADLLASHQVMLVGGSLVGSDDDENTTRQYTTMKEFLREVQDGSNQNYLKYDGHDTWKASIEQGLGGDILQSLLRALDAAAELPFRPCAEYQIGEGWTFWVGAANTSTGMHYDDNDYAFLYVVSGRKRVVLLPNDERTAEYGCETKLEGHSCWTGMDILSGPLPPHAVEIELGPGEGMVIPQLSWHAVQNLEPTIAFGVLLDEDSFC